MSVSAPQEVVARKVMGADEPARPRRLTGTSVLVGGFLILTCLAMLSPIVWTAASVTKPTDVAFLNPPVFTWQPTLDTFVDLWQTTNFYQYVINTLVVAVISTVFALVLGLPCRVRPIACPGLDLDGAAHRGPDLSSTAPLRGGPSHVRPGASGRPLRHAVRSRAGPCGHQPAVHHMAATQLLRRHPDHPRRGSHDGRLFALSDPAARDDSVDGAGYLTAGIFVFLFAFQEYLTATILTDVNARTVPVFIATQLGQTLPMLQQAGAAAVLCHDCLPSLSRSSPRSTSSPDSVPAP